MNTVECKFKCIHETELYPTKTSVIIFSVHSSCRKDAQICQMQGFSGHACPRFLNCISQLYFSTVFINCISQGKLKDAQICQVQSFSGPTCPVCLSGIQHTHPDLATITAVKFALSNVHTCNVTCLLNCSNTTKFIRAIWGSYVQ